MKRIKEVFQILEEDNWLTEQGIIYRGEWLAENECLEEGNKLKAILAAGLVAAGMFLGGGQAAAKNFKKSLDVQKTIKALQQAPDKYSYSKDGIGIQKINGGVIFADDEGNYSVFADNGDEIVAAKRSGTSANTKAGSFSKSETQVTYENPNYDTKNGMAWNYIAGQMIDNLN